MPNFYFQDTENLGGDTDTWQAINIADELPNPDSNPVMRSEKENILKEKTMRSNTLKTMES